MLLSIALKLPMRDKTLTKQFMQVNLDLLKKEILRAIWCLKEMKLNFIFPSIYLHMNLNQLSNEKLLCFQ